MTKVSQQNGNHSVFLGANIKCFCMPSIVPAGRRRLNHRTHFGKRTFQELNIWLKWPKCQPQRKYPALDVRARALLFLLFLQLDCVQYMTSLMWDSNQISPYVWPQFLCMCCCRVIWLWVIQSPMTDALCTKSHYVLVCSHGPDSQNSA